MSSKGTLNFVRVEALRTHMLLNTTHMAKVLGVSRVTYSGWVSGKPIRKGNDIKVRAAIRKIFEVIKRYEWPQPNIIALTPLQRIDTLIGYIDALEPEPTSE